MRTLGSKLVTKAQDQGSISCLKEKINSCFKKIRKIIGTNLIMD